MIRGVHAMFYSTQPEEARAFLRDKLGLPAHDVGDGWLIFDLPQGEVGCHPAERAGHGISFFCDDVHATVEDLRRKGVEIAQEVTDRGWGLCAQVEVPGAGPVDIYEPRYAKG